MKNTSSVIEIWHESKVLKGNPLGDPARRKVTIYFPPGYSPRSHYPALMAIVGFTGTGAMLFNVDPFGEDIRSRLDRLILSHKCPPFILVAPDCFTKVGGNQYINSAATGRYEDFLADELVPSLNRQYPITRWGIFGKSSGGYGSIILGMHRPQVFEAIADHSGDSNFELSYIPDFSKALDAFGEAGGPEKWLKKFWSAKNRHKKEFNCPLNILAMAAHYSPNPKSKTMGIDFPFDLETGAFRPAIWEKWREWDPVNRAKKFKENLRKLKFIYVDCGSKDEFTLQWGARALVKELKSLGLRPHYEEFNDGHMSISYRYDVSIPLLVKALKK